MSSQYHQPAPGNPSPQDASRLAAVEQAAQAAVGYRLQSRFSEASSTAWSGMRRLGFSEASDINALSPSELSKRIPAEAHESAGKLLWVLALWENHSPTGERKLSGFDLALRSCTLGPKFYEGMRTLVHFLGFNLDHGLRREFPHPADQALELWDELRMVGRVLDRHLEATYHVKQGMVPSEINRERGPRREACAWALEAATRVMWQVSAFGRACGNAASDSEVTAYQSRAERYALGVLAANGVSGHADYFNPQAVRGVMPDGARRRIAATLQVLAEINLDNGDTAKAARLRGTAGGLFQGSRPENRTFLGWAHELPVEPEQATLPPAPVAAVAKPPSGPQASPASTEKPDNTTSAGAAPFTIEPGLTWPEIQAFYAEKITEKMPSKMMDRVSDVWPKIVSSNYVPTINLLEQAKEAFIDRRLIERGGADVQNAFFAYAEDRASTTAGIERDVIEVVRLLGGTHFIARRAGIDKVERHKFEQLGRRLESHGRKISQEFGVRGFFSHLHEFFNPIFQ